MKRSTAQALSSTWARISSVMLLVSVVFASSIASGQPEATPFIKAEYWKENISFQDFATSPREYFRSERAFDLLVGYISDETGQSITNAEFVALMNDDNQVRTRSCPESETIRVGGLDGDQFYWFSRACRPGEEIVQLRLGDRWIDMFSLSCLNAMEDPTPVPAPVLTGEREPKVDKPTVKSQSHPACHRVYLGNTAINTVDQFSLGGVYLPGCDVPIRSISGGGGNFIPGQSYNSSSNIQSTGYYVICH